jgi:hypothetical protein
LAEEKERNKAEEEKLNKLILQRDELDYEIKKFKSRKQHLDKQNAKFQELQAHGNALNFQQKITDLQNQLRDMLNMKQREIKDLNAVFESGNRDGKEVGTDPVPELTVNDTATQQKNLATTLTDLQNVLKKKVKDKQRRDKESKEKAKKPAAPTASSTKAAPSKKANGKRRGKDSDEDEEQGGSDNEIENLKRKLAESESTANEVESASTRKNKRASLSSSRTASKRGRKSASGSKASHDDD